MAGDNYYILRRNLPTWHDKYINDYKSYISLSEIAAITPRGHGNALFPKNMFYEDSKDLGNMSLLTYSDGSTLTGSYYMSTVDTWRWTHFIEAPFASKYSSTSNIALAGTTPIIDRIGSKLSASKFIRKNCYIYRKYRGTSNPGIYAKYSDGTEDFITSGYVLFFCLVGKGGNGGNYFSSVYNYCGGGGGGGACIYGVLDFTTSFDPLPEQSGIIDVNITSVGSTLFLDAVNGTSISGRAGGNASGHQHGTGGACKYTDMYGDSRDIKIADLNRAINIHTGSSKPDVTAYLLEAVSGGDGGDGYYYPGSSSATTSATASGSLSAVYGRTYGSTTNAYIEIGISATGYDTQWKLSIPQAQSPGDDQNGPGGGSMGSIHNTSDKPGQGGNGGTIKNKTGITGNDGGILLWV